MTTQTKNEYLIEKIAERLGVPKPAEVFGPDPLALLRGLIDLVNDPAQAKKNAAELAKATDANEAAKVEQKKAADDRKAADADIAAKQRAHDEKLASELTTHSVEMRKRTSDCEAREQAAAKREAELDAREIKIKGDRVQLDKKLAAVKAAAE